MNEKNKIKDRDEGRRGVAILIVIAMLSTLMLMASAFSISMRLERKGAANYRHSVVARHLLWGALGLAMNDIDRDLDGGSGFKVAPDWVVFPSTHISDIPARVATSESQYYIPGSIRDAVLTHNPKPEWIPIFASDNTQIGRCAYLAANVSGLLDGNLAGGTNRAAGSSARELQPRDGMSWTDDAFRRRNDDHFRYESLNEMRRMNLDLYNALGGDNNGFAHVFSCSTEGEFMDSGPDDVKDKISIGGTVSDLVVNREDITNALVYCGINANETGFVFDSLRDYIDEDVWPQSTDVPNVEPIPMVNEVKMRFRYTKPNLEVRVSAEFCYPFLNESKEEFFFESVFSNKFVVNGVSSNFLQATPLSSNSDQVLPLSTKPTLNTGAYFTPEVVVSDFIQGFSTNANSLVMVDPVINITIKSSSGVIVDSISLPLARESGPSTRAPITITDGMDFSVVWEAKDPRYNHLTDFEECWLESSSTWGEMNLWAGGKIQDAQAGSEVWDDEFMWYCANSGTLRNVGELGNLPYTKTDGYLKTLKLYPQGNDPLNHNQIFNEFTMYQADDIPVQRRGLVNVNSTSAKVWEALFRGAPLGSPDEENVDRFGTDDNEEIIAASNIASYVENRRKSSDGPYMDVGEFVQECDWKGVFPNLSDFEREMMISSTAGLLTARQNTFVILLCGEKYVSFALKANEGKSMASMFAVATVSRDPFKDPVTGKHKMFVRSFNVLGQ